MKQNAYQGSSGWHEIRILHLNSSGCASNKVFPGKILCFLLQVGQE